MIYGGGGGVGDAYLYLCAINKLARDGDVSRWWSSDEAECLSEHRPSIAQTFQLMPQIRLEWVDTEPEMYTQEGPRIYIGPRALTDNPTEPDYFPQWDLPPNVHGAEYGCVVLVPRAGRTSHQQHRIISRDAAERVCAKHAGQQIVLLGSHQFPVSASNALNLLGRTSLVEAYAIISRASAFYGTQGALCYAAVSHRVQSHIHAVGEMRRDCESRLWAPYWDYYTPWSPA